MDREPTWVEFVIYRRQTKDAYIKATVISAVRVKDRIMLGQSRDPTWAERRECSARVLYLRSPLG